jgi:PadR family transcriptional regulator, regulatory protein PadR
MRGEALKGHLDMLLLAAVQARPAHGYAVIEELRRLSEGAFDLPEGTVYPALHRLERAGLLASAWSTEAPRRRRVYALTDRGRAALARLEQDWGRFSRGVAGVLSAAPS